MLQGVEQKLNDLVSKCDIDVVLIEHEENNTTFLGIHQIFGHNDEDHIGVSWSEEPILYAENLASLKQMISKMDNLISSGQILTEKELQQFNLGFVNSKIL